LSRINNLSSQRGTAIIIALFVMAMAAAASIAMMSRLQVDIKRTQSLLNATQATQIAQGSVAWAIDRLNMDWQQKKPDQVVDKTPIVSTQDTKDGFKIESVITDVQGLFNINNLAVADYQFDFLRLLKIIEPKLKSSDATRITIAIHDWLTANNSPDIAAYYAGLNPGYKSPHTLMASVSELRLVKGITPTLYTKLMPYVIALPSTTPININNAPAAVLMSLSQSLTYPAAQKVLQTRKQTPFTDTNTFTNLDSMKSSHLDSGKVTILSNYFLLETKVSIGQQQTILYTLLSRTAQGPKSTTAVLWQLKGAM
jgi:general secretion pathway protein K